MVFFGGSVSRILEREAMSEQALARLIGGVGFAEVAQ
jgi:hypothetical protein